MAAKPKKPRDLRGEVIALRDRMLADLRGRPGADARERARQGAWDKILKPRIPDVDRRFRDALKAKRWVFAPGDDDIGVSISPPHWDQFMRQFAAPTYTKLCGAMRQYYSVRVVWRARLRFGFKVIPNAPLGSKKAIAAQKKAAKTEREKKEAGRAAAYKATMDSVLADYASKRESLRALVDGLQDTLNGLMQAEEKRLAAVIRRSPADVQAKAKPQYEKMKELRRDARTFRTQSGENASDYSQQLRRWNGVRKKTAQAVA